MNAPFSSENRVVNQFRLATIVFMMTFLVLTRISGSWTQIGKIESNYLSARYELAEIEYLKSVGKTREQVLREFKDKCIASLPQDQRPNPFSKPKKIDDGFSYFSKDSALPNEPCEIEPTIAMPNDDARTVLATAFYVVGKLFNLLSTDIFSALAIAAAFSYLLPPVSRGLLDFIAPRKS